MVHQEDSVLALTPVRALRLGLLPLLICCSALAQSGNPQVVYDNTANITSMQIDMLPTIAYGDVIALAGEARRITKVEVPFNVVSIIPGPEEEVTADFNLTLWIPGQSRFRPGIKIWESGPISRTLPAHQVTNVTFDVPRVRVPEKVVWTVQVTNFDAYTIAPSFLPASPAVVGNDNATEIGYWIFNPLGGLWFFQDIAASSFAARITAERGPRGE